MSAAHSEQIRRRLERIGIRPDDLAEDYRHGPDLPSYLTLRELQLVNTFALKYSMEYALADAVLIGVLVRDRGMASEINASWVEFEVGVHKFAIWRNTLDLYRVGPDGAVEDDPIHRNN